MTKIEELGKEIEKLFDNLNKVDIKKREDIEFIRIFLTAFNINDPETYNKVTNSSYLVCVLLANNINLDFWKLMKEIEVVDDFVNNYQFDESLYRKYLVSLKELNNLNILDKIKNGDTIKNLGEKEKEIYLRYKEINRELFTLEDEDEKSLYHFKLDDAFIEMFKALPEVDKFESFLDLKLIVEKFKSIFDNQFQILVDEQVSLESNYYDGVKLKKKDRDKLFNRFYKDAVKQFPDLTINQNYKAIVDYLSKTKKQVKEEVSNVNKKLRKIEDFVFKLNYLDPKKVIKLENYEDYLFDPHIRYLFTSFALEHNLELCKDLEEKNREYQNNEITKLEVLFTKYGFNFNDLMEDEKNLIIKKSEEEDIEPVLATLKYSDLLFLTSYHKEFTNLIVNSNVERIKMVDCALKNKIIDRQNTIKHLDILFNEIKYNSFKNNINLLTLKEIDLNALLKSNPEVLFLNNQDLMEIFEVLDEYNFKLDNTNSYEILTNSNLLDIVDNFIELDLFKVLDDNQRVLNNKGYDVIKRILICNLVGISPINSSNKLIGQVTSGNKFYVSPSKYDNYIINSENIYLNPLCVNLLDNDKRVVIDEDIKNSNLVKLLDDLYKRSDLIYEINGVTISRNRVLRNLSVLSKIENLDMIDILYQSILYKIVGNIEDDKLVEIYNSLKMLNIKKDKTYKK